MNAPSRCLPIALTVYAVAQGLAAQEILVSGLDAVAPGARETSDAKLELVACLGDTRLCHPGRCRFARYSPDGKWIYSCGGATVARWNASTGALAWCVCTDDDDEWAVCDVSSAGDQLLVGSRLGKILVLDAQTGRELRSLTRSPGGKRPVGRVTDVAFSPDGRSAAAVDMKGGIRIWNADSGATLEWPERREFTRTECVTFSHGSELLAVTGFGQQPSLDERLRGGKPAGLVVVLDTATGQVKAEAKLGQGEKVDCATFSPDDKLLALGTWGGATEMRQANDLALRWRKEDTKGWVSGVRFSADGQSVLSHGYENVQRRSVATGEPTLVYQPRCDTIHAIDVSRDETRMLVVFRTGSRIQQWDLQRRRMAFEQTGLASPANALTFSPDGTCLASWNSRGGDCVIWSMAEHRAIQRLEVEGKHAGFRDVQFSPDGSHLGVKTDQGKLLTVYTWPDLKPVSGLTAVKATGSFCFSPDGRLMAIGFAEGDVRVQEFPSGKEVARIADTAYNRHELAFTPDGSRLAVSWAAAPHLWDWRNSKMVASLAGRTAGIWMCPSGKFIAGRPARGDLRLWKLDSLTVIERKHLPKPGQWLLFGGFSRDGQRYATAVNGDALRVRRTSDGRSLAGAPLRDFQVSACALSPSGKWLAAGSWDTLIKLYRVPEVQAPPPAALQTAAVPRGAPENALTCRLIVAKTKFSIGEDIPVALGVTNTSRVPCYLYAPSDEPYALGLSLLDGSGSEKDAHERILICPDRTRGARSLGGRAAKDATAIRGCFIKLLPGKETIVATWDLSEMLLPPSRRQRRDPLILHRPGRRRVSLRCWVDSGRRTHLRRKDLPAHEMEAIRALWAQVPQYTALEARPVPIEIVGVPLSDRARIKQAKLYAWAFCHAYAERMCRAAPRGPEPTEAIAPSLALLASDATQPATPVWNPRVAALQTLGGLGPYARSAVPALTQIAERDANEEMRAEAVLGLGGIIADRWVRQRQSGLRRARGRASSGKLTPGLSEPQRSAILQAFERLFKSAPPERVRDALVCALLESRNAASFLKAGWEPLLQDQSPLVRLTALRLAIQYYPFDGRTAGVLTGLLKSPDPRVRYLAFEEAERAASRTYEGLYYGVHQSPPPKRSDPVAMARLKTQVTHFENLAEALIDAATDTTPQPRRSDQHLLPHYAVRWEIYGHGDALGDLVWSPLQQMRDFVPEALAGLRRLVRSNDERLRLRAICVLADCGPAVAVALPELGKAMQDKSEEVCREAARAVAFIDPTNQAALPILLKAAADQTKRPYSRFGASSSESPQARCIVALASLRPVSQKTLALVRQYAQGSSEYCGFRAVGALGPDGKPLLPILLAKCESRLKHGNCPTYLAQAIAAVDPTGKDAQRILAKCRDPKVQQILREAAAREDE